MNWLYERWAAILLAAGLLALATAQHYRAAVAPMTPEEALRSKPAETLRVIGMVQAGTLAMGDSSSPQSMQADFELAGDQEHLTVHYRGPADDNLRELKTLVVIGRLSADGRAIESAELDLVPNYGYITAAYLLSLGSLALFLFGMERRVALLYTDIKDAAIYQPESDTVEQR